MPTFSQTLVYDNLGGAVRLLRNGRVNVYEQGTTTVAAGLTQGGVPVTYITSDNLGLATFTATSKVVDWVSPSGLRVTTVAPQALIDAGNMPTTADANIASFVNTGGSATDVAIKAKYTPQVNVSVNVKNYGAKGDGTTDDRAAIQAALDAGGVGGNVYFPPGTYLLSTATISGNRILKTYADQALFGSGRYVSKLKVANSFGDYVTVLGTLNDSTYCGNWGMSEMGIDQNSTNNALTIASMATYPRMAVRVGSYTAGSVASVRDCAFLNGDSVNAVYVYADTIDVSGNHFINQGGPVGTGSHDHSSIYATSTLAGSTQAVVGNTMRGVKGSGGARTGIETHGGTQTVTGNVVSGYTTGMNLTGVASTYPTDGVVCTGNVVTGACIGIHLWSYYSGTLTTGTATRNVIVSGNSITLDRDAWAGISGFVAFANGVLVDILNTAPTEGLTIADNVITYLPITSNVASDYHSCGISVDVTATAAEIRDLRITNNTVVNPLSTGMNLSATIVRARIAGNTTVNPGQSTDSTVATLYRSNIVLGRTLADAVFEGNTLVDTRGTHYSEYNIYANPTAATNCVARNNPVRYTDGVTPRCGFYPAVSTAGAEFFVEEYNAGGITPAFNTKVGSKVTRTATGQVLVQTTASVGTAWKVSLAQGATTGTTAPAAGGAGALPATPLGYITVNVNGTDRQVAYY